MLEALCDGSFWKHSVMTCQQYVITHLLDASDLSQILPTAMAASNKRTSFCSHLSTVVPRSSHTVFHVLDDALQRHRAPLVIRAHILKRISSSTLSYPGDFLFAREPQTSASLAKRRRTYRNIFCPVSTRDGALLRCMNRSLSSKIKSGLGDTEGQCATTKLSDRRLVRLGTKTVWMLAACFSFSSPVLCVHVST